MSSRKLRVLCFHGFQQNATYMEKKSQNLMKFLPSVDFVFLSGNFQLQPDVHPLRRSWWNSIQMSTKNEGIIKNYVGMIDSLYFIVQYIIDNGPFDGLIGFSQGGMVASLIASLIEHPSFAFNELSLDPNKLKLHEIEKQIKFIIMMSSFIPRDKRILALFNEIQQKKRKRLSIPVLCTYGEQEPLAMEKAFITILPTYFVNMKVVKHEGKHEVPYERTFADEFEQFIKYHNIRVNDHDHTIIESTRRSNI